MLIKNEGNVDRAVRVTVGVLLLALAVIGPKTPLGYLGIVPLLTGLIGFCPSYRLFGFSTCKLPR
jgi:hypothetical protein